jgi:hypothetical protein
MSRCIVCGYDTTNFIPQKFTSVIVDGSVFIVDACSDDCEKVVKSLRPAKSWDALRNAIKRKINDRQHCNADGRKGW